LNLGFCKGISDDGVRYLQALTKLRRLNLDACKVTDVSLEHLSLIPSVEVLGLSRCDQVTDQGIPKIHKLVNSLTSLDLGHCIKVTSQGLQAVKDLSSLRYLNLTGCDIAGETLKLFLASLTNLESHGPTPFQPRKRSLLGPQDWSIPITRFDEKDKEKEKDESTKEREKS